MGSNVRYPFLRRRVPTTMKLAVNWGQGTDIGESIFPRGSAINGLCGSPIVQKASRAGSTRLQSEMVALGLREGRLTGS